MKNILFPKKRFSNTEFNNRDKNIKKNEKNLKIKEKNIIDNRDNDSDNLSDAYKNINRLLSNCIQTIRNEEIDNDTINSPAFKNVNTLIKKKKSSSIKTNKILKPSYQNKIKSSFVLNKSNSLSNSNNPLMTSQEQNLLKSLNIDNGNNKNNISKKKTSPLKINKKSTNQSVISNYRKIKNNILEEKTNQFSKKNTLISYNSKLKNSKSNKILFLGLKKDDESLFNKKKSNIEKDNSPFHINKNPSITNIMTKSSLKTNKTIKTKNNKNLKKNENNCLSLNINSNIENFSPKSIKNNKKNKKVTFRDTKYKRRKNKLKTFGFFSDKYKKYLNSEKQSSKKLIGQLSKLSEEKKSNSSKNLIKFNTLKRPNTMIEPFKINEDVLDNYIKKNTIKTNKIIKTSKQSLKILTLEQIEKNVKETLIGFNMSEVQKELYDLENNDISEVIKNLPTKKNDEKKNQIIVAEKDSSNINENNSLNNSNVKSEDHSNNINKYQSRYRKLFQVRKVYDSLDDEEIADEEVDNFYISPHSCTVYLIDSLILISSLLELYYLPYFLANKIIFCRDIISFESCLFYSIDLIYIIDLITGFLRAYYDFEELLIRNNIDIIINYLKGWFIFDLIEAIPFYTFFNFKEKKCTENIIHYLYSVDSYNYRYSFLIVKIIKIFKAFNSNKAMNKITDFLNNNEFFNNWNGVFFTLFVSLSLIHFCSCIFIYLGRIFHPGWLFLNGIENDSFSYIYVAAIYYLMTTLTTVGYGDISVLTTHERFYQIILLLVGTCAYSWIITFISNYIKKMNEQYIDFENKVKILGEIRISYPLLKNDLYEKIIRYLKYNKAENKYNVDYILDSLPLSLKNNVIIDMYKPIIKNFQFFKSFQNSDFFVKIVTSLKPVLSVKDDILIQEGDVIEDIIFIKKGVLSLEICIDLDCVQESCEAHLNTNKITKIFEHQHTSKSGKGFNSHSLNSSIFNYSKIITHNKKPNIKMNKKQMNIINLRKNEHYGDVLMILNERSPLTVKVKSKKAELFFLQKTEATEISNKYPNIWKRIVHKSLYNMRQIKKVIKKKIIIFCDINGIYLNPELRKFANMDISDEMSSINGSFLLNNQKNLSKNNINKKNNNNLKNKNQINSIIYEVDENIESNRNSFINQNIINTSNKNNVFRFSKKERNSDQSNFFSSNNIKSGIKSFLNKTKSSKNSFKKHKGSENKESRLTFNSLSNSSSKSKSNSKNISKINSNINSNITSNKKDIASSGSEKKKNNQEKEIILKKYSKISNDKENESNKNLNSIKNKINSMITVIEERMNKTHSGKINNLNINFFTQKTINYPINNININKRYSVPNISNEKKNKEYNNEYNKEYNKEYDDVNEEIYSDEDFNINYGKENMSFNNSDKNNNIVYPYLNNYIKNNNYNNNLNDINLSKFLEKNKSKKSIFRDYNNTKSSKNSDLIKSSRFSNYTTTSESFTINSIYENINKLTGYRLKNDLFLQQKIRNYIIDECFFQTNSINYFKKNNFFNNNNSPKDIIKKKNINNVSLSRNSRLGKSSSNNENGNSFLGNIKTDEEDSKTKKIKNRNSLKIRQKRMYSIDNTPNILSKFRLNPNKSIELEKNQRYRKKRRRSTNNKQLKNTSFLNNSNISNNLVINPQDDNFLYKKRTSKRMALKLNDDEEMSFYTKMKTIRNVKNNKNNDKINNNSFIANPRQYSLMDQISHNIQKNKQNLNNPEEYFSGFFSNILQRKKTISKKPFRANKKYSNYNIGNNNIKRTSTSSEVINRNNINHKFII